MSDLLALASRHIDEGLREGPASVNRTAGELSEVAGAGDPRGPAGRVEPRLNFGSLATVRGESPPGSLPPCTGLR